MSADAALTHRLIHGLFRSQPQIPTALLYMGRGSELYRQVVHSSDYYVVRSEAGLFQANGADIAKATGASVLVDLGAAGEALSSEHLLRAYGKTGALAHYFPIDIAGDALEATTRRLKRAFPELSIRARVEDLQQEVPALPSTQNRCVAMLGATFGNFSREERRALLVGLRAQMRDGDTLLLGVDLEKDAARFNRAYNDRQGAVGRFNLNVLQEANRRLGAGFSSKTFTHQAVYRPELKGVEVRLLSRIDQALKVPKAGNRVLELRAGDTLRTAISGKFTLPALVAELDSCGFEAARSWEKDCAVVLARPRID